MFPSNKTFTLRSREVSDFRQGLMGKGWRAGQEWTRLCAGLIHSKKEGYKQHIGDRIAAIP
eukprot:4830460-Ditylum_brightwellii.AAC.1